MYQTLFTAVLPGTVDDFDEEQYRQAVSDSINNAVPPENVFVTDVSDAGTEPPSVRIATYTQVNTAEDAADVEEALRQACGDQAFGQCVEGPNTIQVAKPAPSPPPPRPPFPPLMPGGSMVFQTSWANILPGTVEDFDEEQYKNTAAEITGLPPDRIIIDSTEPASVKVTAHTNTETQEQADQVQASLTAACNAGTLGECVEMPRTQTVQVDAPSPPPMPLPPLPSDNTGSDSGSAAIAAVAVVALIPLAWLVYVKIRYNGKVGTYLKWRTTHSNPYIVWRYMPDERRAELYKQLYGKDDAPGGRLDPVVAEGQSAEYEQNYGKDIAEEEKTAADAPGPSQAEKEDVEPLQPEVKEEKMPMPTMERASAGPAMSESTAPPEPGVQYRI